MCQGRPQAGLKTMNYEDDSTDNWIFSDIPGYCARHSAFFPGGTIFILEKSSGNGHKFTRHRACTLFHGQTPRDITDLHQAFLQKETGSSSAFSPEQTLMSDHFGNISITPSAPASAPPEPEKQRPGKRQDRKPLPEKKRVSKKKLPPAAGRSNKVVFILAAVLVLLPLFYSLGGFWLVPLYMSRALPARLAEKTGMTMSMQAIDFNPFTFKFSVQGLRLQPARPVSAIPEMLAVARIDADLAPLSLLRSDLVSNRLAIEGLDLNIIRSQDKRYNIEEFFRTEKTGSASDIMSFSELPFLFSLNNISIRNSKVTFQDIPAAATHTLDQVELDLPSFSNFPFQADEYIRPRFSAVINGSKIALTGQAALPAGDGQANLETKLSCRIEALDLPVYFNYLPASLPITLTKGKADGNLQLSFSRATKKEGAKISLHFAGEIAGMEIAGKEKPISAAIPKTTLEGSFFPISRALHINKLSFEKPQFTSPATLDLNTLAVFLPAVGEKAAQKTTSEVVIDLLQMEDGRLDIPAAKKQKQKNAWESLQLSIKDYARNGKTGTSATGGGSFSLSGEKSDSDIAFSWQGRFNERFSPVGRFTLDNLPAAAFFAAIGMAPETVRSGTANLQGILALTKKTTAPAALVTDLSQAEVTLQGLKLLSGKEQWLDAPTLKLAGFRKKASQVDLGDLRLENGAVTLDSDKLPEIFQSVAAKNSKLSLQSLDYSGKITVSGKSAGPLTLTSVLLQAKSLKGTDKQDMESLLFSAKVNETGLVKAKGAARLAPFHLSLNTGFSGIEARTLLPWFSTLPLLTEARSVISGKGLLSLPDRSFSGQLRLDNAVFNRDGKPLLNWQSCDLQGLAYSRTPFHLGIALMEIDQPVMNWQRSARETHPAAQFGTFLQGLLPAQGKTPPQGKGTISISQLDIQEIRLKNGKVQYSDSRLSPPWSTVIQGLDGTITGLHSHAAKEQSQFTFSGVLNQTPFTVNGSADFFSTDQNGQAAVTISDLPLSTFGKYLPDSLGIDKSAGSFTMNSSSSWNGKQLTGKTQYLFSGLRPVSPEAEAALPLALLRNAEGRVALNVNPVRSLSEGSVPLLQDTLTTFQRQLLKAKVSPLLLASGDYTDLVGNEYADFQPGSFTLTENGHKILSRFSAFLGAHPSVGLRLTGCADRIIDGKAMQKQLEEVEAKRVEQENRRRKAAWQKERDLDLERRRAQQQLDGEQGIIEEDLPLQESSAYAPIHPAPVVIDDSMLEDLAMERAARVQALLTEKLALDPARIVVSQELKLTSDKSSPGNRTLIDLKAYTPPERKSASPEIPGQ